MEFLQRGTLQELLLPALRIAEDYAEDAAVAIARLVKQHRPVQLTQFSGDEQPQSGTPFTPGKKWFEDAIDGIGLDAGTAVSDFEAGAVAGSQPAQLDFEADVVARPLRT